MTVDAGADGQGGTTYMVQGAPGATDAPAGGSGGGGAIKPSGKLPG